MGISGWQLLEKQAQLLCCGCRDTVSFSIWDLTLYLNPNSLDTEHAEAPIGAGIAAQATLWVVM